ncbi:choice-of-anchor L domain-containing protein, partial [Cribrihabitans sp. XS_ASV171]
MPSAQDLPIDTSASAEAMAAEMFGTGIDIVSASYTGAAAASGIYTDGDAVAPGITPSDSGVILSTGRAGDITNASGDANASSGTSTRFGRAGDSDLDEIAGARTYDAAVFEAEFVPEGSTLTMQVVFSSEEYLEYVGSGFNDAVGVWVNGEKAELTVGDGDITINNINDESNSNLYNDNPASAEAYNTEMDGFTVTLTLKAPVTPGAVNTIKIGIADGGDGHYDSNLLIAGDSVQTALIAQDDSVEITGGNAEVV